MFQNGGLDTTESQSSRPSRGRGHCGEKDHEVRAHSDRCSLFERPKGLQIERALLPCKPAHIRPRMFLIVFDENPMLDQNSKHIEDLKGIWHCLLRAAGGMTNKNGARCRKTCFAACRSGQDKSAPSLKVKTCQARPDYPTARGHWWKV